MASTPDTIPVSVDLSLKVNGKTVKSVQQLMAEVLSELPAIGKSKAEGSGLKYAFRGIEDVLNALNPLLSSKGLFVVPHEVVSVHGSARETKGGSLTYNVRLSVRYRWYGPAGDFVECASVGEGSDTQDKSTQKAMTSAFKYMLFETFSISTEEGAASDIDATQNHEETVLSEQEQRKRAYLAAGGEVLEGWADFEEQDTEHQTYQAGMADLPPLEQEYMKKWRRDEKIPWPCSKADMERLCEAVVAMKAERFGAEDGTELDVAPSEAAADAEPSAK